MFLNNLNKNYNFFTEASQNKIQCLDINPLKSSSLPEEIKYGTVVLNFIS